MYYKKFKIDIGSIPFSVNFDLTAKFDLWLIYCYNNLMRRMKNRHFYFLILVIQIIAVGLILLEHQQKWHQFGDT